MVCHLLTVRKFFSGARSEESEPEESHQINKESKNYALLLIEIQYSVVLMVVIGTMAIIYNYGKKKSLVESEQCGLL